LRRRRHCSLSAARESLSPTSWLCAQRLSKDCRLPGRDGHPLSIDRIEGAQRISHDQQPLGNTGQALIVPPAVGRKFMQRDRRERCGLLESRMQIGLGQAARKVQKSGVVTRRMIRMPSRQRRDPAIPFNREKRS
jgi:hypothetical protein